MLSPSRRRWLLVALLYAGLAGSLTSFHAFEINFGDKLHKRTARHAQIVSMLAGKKPWAYRVAVPLTVEHTLRPPLMATGMRPIVAREYGYLIVRFASTWLTLLGSHLLIRRLVPRGNALAGGVLVAALHGPSTAHYWFQPASQVDHLWWLAAALLTLARRDALLVPLIFVASVNRETAVFAVPIHFALRWGTEPVRHTLLRCVAMTAAWSVPFFMLRELVVLSPRPGRRMWKHFTTNLHQYEWQWYAFVFAGAWTLLPLLGLRRMPRALRLLMAALVPYVVLVFAFGRIREVRLFLPLTVAFVPALMWLLADRSPADSPAMDRSRSGPDT